jgi:hypothetical protein
MRGYCIPRLVHPEAPRIAKSITDLKRDRAAVIRASPDPRSGRDERAVNRGVNREQRRGRKPVVNRIIDQRRVPTERPALRGALKVRLPRLAILEMGELVPKRSHHLREHHARIGFEPFLPAGIALRREVEQREAEAREIAREIIDRKIYECLVGTGRLFLAAIEPARAALFEGEFDVVEERIKSDRVDVKRVDRKIAGVRRFDLEHHALLAGESSADKARRRHLDLGDRITARDADDADIICEERRFLRRRQGRNDRPRRDDEIGIDTSGCGILGELEVDVSCA